MLRHRLFVLQQKFLITLILMLGAASIIEAQTKDKPQADTKLESIDLLAGNDLKAFRSSKSKMEPWAFVDQVGIDPKQPGRLSRSNDEKQNNKKILVNGSKGRSHDLYTTKSYGDLKIELEFMIPKKSNSGIKFQGLYEIQIYDSYGKQKVTGDDCGGIYPRAEFKPRYHHIDEGIPPKVNACKQPGEWQLLVAEWRAPKFNEQKQKIANGCIVKATLNGQVIHENQELTNPTGHNYKVKESPTGPLMLQGDHGPIAIRRFIITPIVKP